MYVHQQFVCIQSKISFDLFLTDVAELHYQYSHKNSTFSSNH